MNGSNTEVQGTRGGNSESECNISMPGESSTHSVVMVDESRFVV